MQYIKISLQLLAAIIIIVCGIYTLCLFGIGQILFPYQANGSMLYNQAGIMIGSSLIAQEFVLDEYFKPRPSAANFDAAYSRSSALAGSNYKLRARIASSLGPTIHDADGNKVADAIDKWFAKDIYQGEKGIVAKWAQSYPEQAKSWANMNEEHASYISLWAKSHPDLVENFMQNNLNVLVPTVSELTILFFQNFSKQYPGKFPEIVLVEKNNGENLVNMIPISSGKEIQQIFFVMWMKDNPGIKLQNVASDMVTTSGSGLDPHISLKSALQQLDGVSSTWAKKLKLNHAEVNSAIGHLLIKKSFYPIWGLGGEPLINVLEVNLEINNYISKKTKEKS